MLIKGFIAWLISIAYSIPLILYTLLLIPLVGFGALTGGQAEIFAGAAAIWVFGAFFLSILIGYLLPAAYTNYARTDRAGAAFELGTITSIAFTRDYLVGIIFALIIGLMFGILIGILSITVIGAVLIPFLSFYMTMAMAYVIGRSVSKASR